MTPCITNDPPACPAWGWVKMVRTPLDPKRVQCFTPADVASSLRNSASQCIISRINCSTIRPRHTLQRSEARSRGSVASTVGWVQRFKGLDRSSSLPTVRTVIPLRRLPPRRSWFQSPVPRMKRRKRRNGFRQSGADWETAAAFVKMETEASVLIRPLIATPAQGISRS